MWNQGYQTGPCEHKESHEHFDEWYPGSWDGYWETGYRCKKCGQHWPDYEHQRRVQEKQEEMWREHEARHYSVLVGTDVAYICDLSGEWGDIDQFREDYDRLRQIIKEEEGRDIGTIYDKRFVFHDDLGPLDDSIEQEVETGGFNIPYVTEWNLLQNWPGMQVPMHSVAKRVWDKHKLTFEQALEKIRNHPNSKLNM